MTARTDVNKIRRPMVPTDIPKRTLMGIAVPNVKNLCEDSGDHLLIDTLLLCEINHSAVHDYSWSKTTVYQTWQKIPTKKQFLESFT